MLYFHRSIRNRPLCKERFAECSVTYAYVYRFDMVTKESRNKDFNQELVISGIRKVLSKPEMNNPHSVLVLNLGLHFMKTVNFSTYQKLLEGVKGLLRPRQTQTESGFRSTTQNLYGKRRRRFTRRMGISDRVLDFGFTHHR